MTRASLAAWLLLAGLVASAPTRAQDAPAATTITIAPEPPDESVGFENPRSAMRGFLWAGRDGDWKTAATFLDLRGRDEKDGPRLARELKTVLDRKLWIDLDALSNAAEGDPDDKQPRNRDAAGAFQLANGDWAKILLDRVTGPDGTRHWRIARATVEQTGRMWRDFGDGPLAERLPDPFFDIRFLDVQLWQWIALTLLLLVAVLLPWLLTAPLLRLARAIARRTSTPIDDVLANLIIGPIRLAVGTAVFLAGTYPLWLPLRTHRGVIGLCTGLITIAITWFLLRLIDAMARVMMQRYLAHGQLVATSVVPLARRALKVFVALLALLAILQNLDFNVTGIIAGLGIGGLAVALAARKSIDNLFGGLSIIADQPVRVGDFCKFGETKGTVEDIGLRSTRVRTLDRTVVTIPNADFASLQIENFDTRDRFRFAPTLGLRYETTPDQLRWVLVELKKLLLAHPKVSPELARVRFVNLGAWSLDLEILAYIVTRDVDEFMAVREDLLLRIIDLVAAAGTGFALPAQLAYTALDAGIDLEARQAAEAKVKAWRNPDTLAVDLFPVNLPAQVLHLESFMRSLRQLHNIALIALGMVDKSNVSDIESVLLHDIGVPTESHLQLVWVGSGSIRLTLTSGCRAALRYSARLFENSANASAAEQGPRAEEPGHAVAIHEATRRTTIERITAEQEKLKAQNISETYAIWRRETLEHLAFDDELLEKITNSALREELTRRRDLAIATLLDQRMYPLVQHLPPLPGPDGVSLLAGSPSLAKHR